MSFHLVDHDTGEPIPGVDLRIRKPDGSTEVLTTDGGGTIRLTDLPEGTCDIEAMLDAEALEVTAVEQEGED